MFLEIPVKLEGYVDEIKSKAVGLDKQRRMKLVQVGKTSTTKSTKLMYLIYNPYPKTLYVDPNLFTPDSGIYKLYPSNFEVPSNTAFAFIAFVENTLEINVDIVKFTNELKNDITIKLNSLTDYKPSRTRFEDIIKIEADDIHIGQTVYIDESEIERILNPMVTTYQEEYEDMIDISLKQVTQEGSMLNLLISFNNTNPTENFKIEKFRLKLSDGSKKMYIPVNDAFILKALASKDTEIKIAQTSFELLDAEKLEMKINIL